MGHLIVPLMSVLVLTSIITLNCAQQNTHNNFNQSVSQPIHLLKDRNSSDIQNENDVEKGNGDNEANNASSATTAAGTTPPPTTAPPTTAPTATPPPTTALPTTTSPTKTPPTAASPITTPPTTPSPTTGPATTAPPTMALPTTAHPTTAPLTTAAPTTAPSKTAPPTTDLQITASPTTTPPTTAPPTTAELTTADDSYAIKVCDFYRDAWKGEIEEKWMVGKEITSPLFCAGNPFWYPKPYEPTCNKNWPIRVEFYDGSKYENGTLITCFVNMAESKNSSSTRNCLNKVVNGFDGIQTVDWIVYLSSGYNSRILWYHDFAEALIKRFQNSNRRIVVAMIYWEEMANAVHSQQWYEEQIQLAIKGNPKGDSRSTEQLPHGQSWASRWSACLTSSYKQAATNVPVVGHVVGELVKYIRSDFAKGGSYTTYCIGFSLGAHNCGFIGKSSNMVDKIVALDPAGAIFDNHPPEYRLAKGDATVIHVFHTSSEFTGLVDPIGDVDFYPNGLWYNQPQTCPNGKNLTCGCPSSHNFANTPSKYFPFFYNNLDCSHQWGMEFLVRLWEQNRDNWYCNSTVYCTSMNGYFPSTLDEVGMTKSGYNECFEGDSIQVGNLETMTKNDNGIRWFETQHSDNCKFVNTVQEVSKWTEVFKPNIRFEDYFN